MDLHLNEFATVSAYTAYIEGSYLKPNVSHIIDGDIMKYQKDAPIPPSEQYLTFEALEDGTFQLSDAVDYSLDNGATWATLAANTASPTVASGSTIMWKAEKTSSIGTFSSTGSFNVKGNIMSLLYGDNFIGQTDLKNIYNVFNRTFVNSKVVSAGNLVLPAITLTQGCYMQMFYNCTSLTTAPELPATTLVKDCYQFMLGSCSSLNYIKMLATDISASGCLSYWVEEVTAPGTFVKAAGVTLPTGGNGIPSGWTVIEV